MISPGQQEIIQANWILCVHVGLRLLQLVTFIALITSDRCWSWGVPEYI